MSGASSAQVIYSHTRCVSAVITAEYIGDSATDAGTVIGFWVKPKANDTTQPNTFSGTPSVYPVTQDVPGSLLIADSTAVPLRNGMRQIWKPSDNRDMEFQVSAAAGSDAHTPLIGIIAFGGTPSKGLLRIKIVANYEGIPAYDTTGFVDARPSPVNPTLVWEALSYMQTMMPSGQTFLNYLTTSKTGVAALQYAGAYVGNRLRRDILGGNSNQVPRLAWHGD